MNKVVVFFDFDGTLTHGDSLLPFLRMVRGTPRFMLDMLAVAPCLAAYALRLIRNDAAKETLLRQSLGGMPISILRDLGKRFAEQDIPSMLQNETLDHLKGHQAQGHHCILVSASLSIYLEPWAKAMGFDHCIASALSVDVSGNVTGKLEDGNCHGEEKVRRIRLLLKKVGLPQLTYAYGDSQGDLPMLTFVNKGFLVKRRCVELVKAK